MDYKDLTKAEEQIMHILWDLDKAFIKEIIETMEDPKPAYNTVSTIVRILETKGFVAHNAFGKSHQYYPVISKEEYTGQYLTGFLKNYFGNSYKQLVSFFSSKGEMSVQEIEEIRKVLDQEIQQRKSDDNG